MRTAARKFFALCISLILRVVGQEGLVGVRPTSCPELLLTDLLIFVQSILGKSSEMSTVHASPLMVRVESSLTCLGTGMCWPLCGIWAKQPAHKEKTAALVLFFLKPSASKIRGLAVNFDPKI